MHYRRISDFRSVFGRYLADFLWIFAGFSSQFRFSIDFIKSLLISLFRLPSSFFRLPSYLFPCSLLMARPGGMRGAVESAALGLKPRAGVSNPQPKSITQISNLQISDPLISPPAPLRIPPGHPKWRGGLIFVIFISLGTRRAKCKKTVLGRP